MKTKKKAKISTKRKTNTVEDDEDEVSIIEDDTKLSQYLKNSTVKKKCNQWQQSQEEDKNG